MATIKLRRMTDAARLALGAVTQGEPIWTTDTKKLYIGDGITEGGEAVDKAGGATVTVENALTSTSTTNALSAAMGKSLSDAIEALEDAIAQSGGGLTEAQVTTLINDALNNFEVPPSLTLATPQQHIDGTATDVATNPAGVKAMIEQRIMSNNGGVGSTLYSGAAANVHSVDTIYNDADGYTYMLQFMSATASALISTELTAIVFRSQNATAWDYIGMINVSVGSTPSLLLLGGIVRLFAVRRLTNVLTVYNISNTVSVGATRTVDAQFAVSNGLVHGAAVEHDGKIVFAVQASNNIGTAIRLGSWDLNANIFTWVTTTTSSNNSINIVSDGLDVFTWTDNETGRLLKYNVAANTFVQAALTGTMPLSERYRQAVRGDLFLRGRIYDPSYPSGLDLLYFNKSTGLVDRFNITSTFPSDHTPSPKQADAVILNGHVYIAYSDKVSSITVQRVNIDSRAVRTTTINSTAARGAELLINAGRLLLMSWNYSSSGMLKIQEIEQ